MRFFRTTSELFTEKRISARSLGNKNVQRVMEKMGGGGHLSNAATQLTDMSIEEAIEQLKIVIQELDTEINL